MNETAWISKESARSILVDLIAIPSVNPMGRPWQGSEPVERGVLDYLERVFGDVGVTTSRQSISPMHESLFVPLPGTDELGGTTLFEAHADTVPADDWADRAFSPEVVGDTVVGRGACDDKGSLVSMALAVLDISARGLVPPQPVLLMAAGDEEYAQTGIKHYRAEGGSPARGVFGEPSGLHPIVQHNGTIRWDITVHGRSAHTSRPQLGVNAILAMSEVFAAIRAHQDELARNHQNPFVPPPTLTVTMINGGRTRNAVPDECTVSLDYRVSPGTDPLAARDAVVSALDELDLAIRHGEVQLMTPPLTTSPDDPFTDRVVEVCRKYGHEDARAAGVPYGTDASWISELGPALVLGPGSIDVAHAVDEHVDVAEVVACAEMHRELMLSDYRS